jgi:hypothetical protein
LGPEGGEIIGKSSYFNLPPDIGFTLFTPINGRMDSLTARYPEKYEKPMCCITQNIRHGPGIPF